MINRHRAAVKLSQRVCGLIDSSVFFCYFLIKRE